MSPHCRCGAGAAAGQDFPGRRHDEHEHPAGCDSRRIAAPCVSMSRMTSCPPRNTPPGPPEPSRTGGRALRPLRKFAAGRHGPERRLIHEMVVAAVHFVRPGAGRVRNRVTRLGTAATAQSHSDVLPARTAPTPPRASAGRSPVALAVAWRAEEAFGASRNVSTSWDPPSRCASVLDWTADRMTWRCRSRSESECGARRWRPPGGWPPWRRPATASSAPRTPPWSPWRSGRSGSPRSGSAAPRCRTRCTGPRWYRAHGCRPARPPSPIGGARQSPCGSFTLRTPNQ